MPELPEVEVTRRSVAPRIEGARIAEVWQGASLRWPLGCAPQRLVGLRVAGARRRGKYLLLDCEDAGAVQGTLIVHLGMSGSLGWAGADAARGPWVRFELATDRGRLQLDDPRRFGAVVWHEGAGVEGHALLAALGPEPLEAGFDGARLYAATRGRRQSIKELLLGGRAVVGVGNIYACEALFRAGIDPRAPAARLGRARCDMLAAAVRAVLAEAIERGGSTLRDFADAEGRSGYFQLDAAVYGRAGAPCRVCSQPVVRIVQGQRSSYFCRHCQRR
jgi:formamidopyrimidine-DNA glycosylase